MANKKPKSAPNLTAANAKLEALLAQHVADNEALNARADLTPDQKIQAAAENHEKTMRARQKIIGPLGAAPSGFTFYGQELLCTTGSFSFTGVMMERATTSLSGDNIRLKDAATGLTGADIFRDAGREVTLVGFIKASSGVSGFTEPAYGAVLTANSVAYALTNSTPEFSDGPAKVTLTGTRKNSITYA